MTTRGIFILENVRSRQREGEWVPVDNVWVNPGSGTPVQWKSGDAANPNKGFFYADTGSWFTFDMNTDTHNELGSDSGTSGQGQGFSSLTHGYKAGGSNPGGTSVSDIEKIAYATNTGSGAGSMNRQRRGPMASGNMTHAWIGSGFSHGPGPAGRTSDFAKYTYSTEGSAASPSVNVPYQTSKGGGAGNQEYGYIRDGEYNLTWTYKITYASDTGARAPGADAAYRYNGSRSWSNPSSGFWAGGSNSINQSVTRIPFATETATQIPGVVATNTGTSGGGAAGNHTHGYFQNGGGSRFHKFDYATDTGTEFNTTPASFGWGNSVFGQSNGPLVTNPNTETPTPVTSPVATDFGLRLPGGTTIDKLDFTTDTTSVGMQMPSTPETGGHDGHSWYDQNGGRAIFGTGGASGPINQINVGSLTGSRIPSLSPVATVPNTSYGLYKTWNYSATEGWYQGGRSWSPSYPSHNTTASRMTFATDTLSDQSYGRLSSGIERAQGLSNPTHKYSIGGRSDNPSAYDTTYTFKAPFASGDFSQVPSASLNANTSDHGGTGNATEGYIAGRDSSPANGANPESRFQKLTYSNDTMSTLPGSTLGISVPDSGRGLEGTGTKTTGYFGGGDYMGPLNGSNFPIVKLVYATGTPSSIPHWVTDSNTRNAAQQSSGEQSGNGLSPVPNMMK